MMVNEQERQIVRSLLNCANNHTRNKKNREQIRVAELHLQVISVEKITIRNIANKV